MTSGNSTTLQLTGWDGCILDSVVLSMHSNTAQGAGSLTMHIGERLVWKIADADFAHDTWYGSYTTNWVDITEYRDQKDKACHCHVSQGMDEIKIWHDAMEIMRGLEHHCKYGEAFVKQQWKD